MFERLQELIRKAEEEVSTSEGLDIPTTGSFEFNPTQYEIRGLFSTAAAFPLVKQSTISAEDILNRFKNSLEKNGANFFSKLEIKDGFINFSIRPEVIREEFKKIAEAGKEWGRPRKVASRPRGRVIVEYSQPNIAKPMHVGHLRSTIIGDALANVLEFAGCEVIRWNYLGDWGTQFGNVIAAYKLWGEEEEVQKKLKETPIEALAELYARFHEAMQKDPSPAMRSSLEERGRKEFRDLEEDNSENWELWGRFNKESIKELEKIYALLGIEFDEWKGESSYRHDLPSLIASLQEKGIARESEGAVIVSLEKYNLPPALIQKSDGATLYLTRDIASLKDRVESEEYKADSILYVVDNGQSLHFQQLFAIAEILGLKGKFIHVKFGLVLGEDLKRLSTRAGSHIALLEVINEAVGRARKIIEEKQPDMTDVDKEKVAQVVGIGVLKYNDLSQSRVADITFDWDKMLSLQGNSAPYLQYTYARLKSILRKAGNIPSLETGAIEKEADLRLILRLAFFPEVIKAVSENYLPHQLATYLYELARAINDYYEKEPILKAETELRAARLQLVKAASETLETGLGLLGIRVPERM